MKKIKYKETDLQEMRRIIKAFNQRRSYQIKKHPETANIQPPKMKIKQVKESIYSKQDFEQWKQDTKMYNAKTAKVVKNKQGVQSTIYNIEKAKNQIERKNKKAKEEQAKKQKVFVNGKEIKNAKKVITEKEKKPFKIDFEKATTQKAWNKTVESLNVYLGEKDKRHAELYFNNLLEGLKKNSYNYEEFKLLYDALGVEIIDALLDLGFDAVDLDFIYDVDIDDSDKDDKIFEELTEQIKERNKVDIFVNLLSEYYNVQNDPTLKKLWDVLGNENIFNLYREKYLVNYPKELYEQIDKLGLQDKLKEAEKQARKAKRNIKK